MADQEPVPEADAQEQALPVVGPEETELGELPADANEADVLDQARPVAEAHNGTVVKLRPDVPEADALDQERPAEVEEDDWR